MYLHFYCKIVLRAFSLRKWKKPCKVHSFLKQWLHELCLTQKNYNFTKSFSRGQMGLGESTTFLCQTNIVQSCAANFSTAERKKNTVRGFFFQKLAVFKDSHKDKLCFLTLLHTIYRRGFLKKFLKSWKYFVVI